MVEVSERRIRGRPLLGWMDYSFGQHRDDGGGCVRAKVRKG